ncbi:hypothetical protein [uncultured Parasutterella sp.]|uniref:hypothetical protein n=1 Tax=uncultured Parasutterella sp. TaxID=1263098 RepID=UPI0025959B9B|nr:hypothetical protein [uncultured Parasutterella sp.]
MSETRDDLFEWKAIPWGGAHLYYRPFIVKRRRLRRIMFLSDGARYTCYEAAHEVWSRTFPSDVKDSEARRAVIDLLIRLGEFDDENV